MTMNPSIPTQTATPERRDIDQPIDRLYGHVVSCSGSVAMIAADRLPKEISELWTVSRLVSILHNNRRIVGMIASSELTNGAWVENGVNTVGYKLELIGEVWDDPKTGRAVFDRGISAYPPIGSPSHAIRTEDLFAIYTNERSNNLIPIGNLSQSTDIIATVDLDMMLTRHFAVIGSTGVGKSSAVTLMMRKAVEARKQLRIVMLDPHNEFAKAFPNHAKVLDVDNLTIPYWMLTLEELLEIIYRGRKDLAIETDILRGLISEAKHAFRTNTDNPTLRRDNQASIITADTPIPYRFNDLIKLIDARMGLLESKPDLPLLRTMRGRLVTTMNDPRYAFFFKMRRIADNMEQVMTEIFRMEEHTDRPISVIQMAGLPTEVVNSLISVIGRLAFDLCQMSNGGSEILILCEEAHRYMPANESQGFEPTRYALARIAKEGRKYGCYLGCITQRPGELDQTILSQCSTIFAMRLSNEADQDLIRAAISDSSESTTAFISSLAQREAIAFGEGVATPMRLLFETIPAHDLPSTRAGGVARQGGTIRTNLSRVVTRLRDNLPEIANNIVEQPSVIDELEEMDEMTRIRQRVLQRSHQTEVEAQSEAKASLFRPI